MQSIKFTNSQTTITLSILLVMFVFSSVVLSMYPQNILLSNDTKISPTVYMTSDNMASVRGNQFQFGTDDYIILDGREYIKITGNQKTIGTQKFVPGIRTLTSSFTQNALFETPLNPFPLSRAAKLTISDNYSINLIPLSSTIMKIQTVDSDYNLDISSGTAYFKADGYLFKIKLTETEALVYIVGLSLPETISTLII